MAQPTHEGGSQEGGIETIRCWHYLSHFKQSIGKSSSSCPKEKWDHSSEE
jgi:hypothetical protein